jgi:hypothetical protein
MQAFERDPREFGRAGEDDAKVVEDRCFLFSAAICA